MTDKKLLQHLSIQIDDLIECIPERALPFGYSDEQNSLFMNGYRCGIRDTVQRLVEILGTYDLSLEDIEMVADWEAKIYNSPDHL